ncbi:MAG: extracellular solute-binding protein [Firmicutes bacterium]|nr:extracellular solute-binding protein [Bacillota bacterium]
MKVKMKVLLLPVLLVALFALAACGGGNDTNDGGTQANNQPAAETPVAPAPEPEPAAQEEPSAPPRDLGGREIVIGNWWANWCVDTAEPTTLQGEARLDDRIYVMDRYNFTMREENLGGWGYIQEIATMSILAGDPAADIFILSHYWFGPLMTQGLLAPITTVDFTDTSEYTWNQNTVNMARDANGVPHGWSRDIQTGPGLWFNMRLLEEAGVDPYLPFDLQLRGEWTWDAWLELLHATTRDIDNTGINDTWGFAGFSSFLLMWALPTNNARYIYRDAQGRFHNQTNTPEFLETLTFINNLRHVENVMMPQPPDTPWNWFDYAFRNGEVAWFNGGSGLAGTLANYSDDPFGFVTFPVGPSGTTHRFQGNTNFNVIPSTFNAQEVDDIMFAYLMWQRPLPGFDDPDAWKAAAYLVHSTPRNVDETMALFGRDGTRWEPMWHAVLPGPGFHEGEVFSWRMWHEGSDAAVIVEEAQPLVNDAVAEANRILGF